MGHLSGEVANLREDIFILGVQIFGYLFLASRGLVVRPKNTESKKHLDRVVGVN